MTQKIKWERGRERKEKREASGALTKSRLQKLEWYDTVPLGALFAKHAGPHTYPLQHVRVRLSVSGLVSSNYDA